MRLCQMMEQVSEAPVPKQVYKKAQAPSLVR